MPALWQKIETLATSSRLQKILASIDDEIADHNGLRSLLGHLDRSKDPLQEYSCDRLDSPAAARLLTIKVINLLLARWHFQ
jgi:hypothetical protein